MECQVSSTYHQKKKNKGKIKNKATFLKIYTVLDFTHEPETIHWETFLWIFGKYFQLATKNKEHQNKTANRIVLMWNRL